MGKETNLKGRNKETGKEQAKKNRLEIKDGYCESFWYLVHFSSSLLCFVV
jgi:hypothetical protein